MAMTAGVIGGLIASDRLVLDPMREAARAASATARRAAQAPTGATTTAQRTEASFAAARRQRAMSGGGRQDTILTGPLGVIGDSVVGRRNTLLGQ